MFFPRVELLSNGVHIMSFGMKRVAFLKCKQVEIIYLKKKYISGLTLIVPLGLCLDVQKIEEGYKCGTIYFGHGILSWKFIEQIYMFWCWMRMSRKIFSNEADSGFSIIFYNYDNFGLFAIRFFISKQNWHVRLKQKNIILYKIDRAVLAFARNSH